ncbi:MAG: hypothetical protein AB1324_07175 [Candidatus Micrarchaeota archaeon]
MTTMKGMFGLMLFVLMAASAFAASSYFAEENQQPSITVIEAANNEGRLLNLSVLVFQQATSTGGTDIRTVMDQINQECASAPDRQACIQQKGLERTAASRDYQLNLTSLQSAHLVVEYLDPAGNNYQGQWLIVPGCENVITDIAVTRYRPDPVTGVSAPYNYYIGQCDITPAVTGANRTQLRALYVGDPVQAISPSGDSYQYDNFNVTVSTQFSRDVQNFINTVAQSGGQGVNAGGTLPCVGVFMILGLLLASLYFSGRSPISLLDITTPRLPAPKGVTAGGQILAPYGYTEMKATARQKMEAAAAAASMAAGRFIRPGDADTERLVRQINSDRGTAADRAAGDVAQGRKIATALVGAGRSLGMNSAELQSLARLPYHYGDAEHRTVAQIIQNLEKKGGSSALLAMTLKDYMFGMQTWKSLEVVTGQPDFGKRGTVHYFVSSKLGKAFGSNRYTTGGVSTIVMAGTDSMFRTGRVMTRMTKTMATEAPTLLRQTTRTTMEMLGGPRVIEELEARGRTSPTAGWLAGQLQKHPSQVVVGAMFPINDHMAQLYKTTRNEALHSEMVYVMRQLYKKMGVRFDISEQELTSMGHTDIDIRKRCNITSTAALLAVEEEMRKVMSNATMSSQDKLTALMRIAESHGAYIDHQMVNFTRRLDAIEATGQPDHMKMLMLQQAIEEQNKVKMAVYKGGGRSEDAYVCHVGERMHSSQVWEYSVLRTMQYDWEHGYAAKGGIEQAAVRERLFLANKEATLNPAAAGHDLPEHMRNTAQLKAVTERNRSDLVSLFTEQGREMFQQRKGKSITSASISEIVDFMYGGNLPRTFEYDKKTGRAFWPGDKELPLDPKATFVDMKRHWIAEPNSRERGSVGEWTESRFKLGHLAAFDASVDAQLKRMPGYANMTGEQESQAAKKLWVQKAMLEDIENRFNSQFGMNAYGNLRETMKFNVGIMAGFLERALEEKKLPANHPDLKFLQRMDISHPEDVKKFRELLKAHGEAYQGIISRQMTYDEIAKSPRAIVLLQEGGYAYYKKGMTLSDNDRVMAGQAALRDNKGQLRAFVPEDVPIKFEGREDLMAQHQKLRASKDPNEWHAFAQNVVSWAKSGGYNFDRERVLAAVLWDMGHKTGDYGSFWNQSAVSVEAKRNVAPVAPSVLRMFGVEAPEAMKAAKPFRDIGMHMGDYVSKIAYMSGGPLLDQSYKVAAYNAAYQMQSYRLALRIQEGHDMGSLSAAEQAAYRTYASKHGAYLQASQWALDRSPFGYSTSHATQAADAALFSHGPGLTFKMQDYLGAAMDKGTMRSFKLFYAWPMDLARKLISPYATAVSTAQKEMMGRASRWDTTGDPTRTLYHGQPRVRSAMQAFFNPLGLSTTSKWAKKLNIFAPGDATTRQVGGEDVMLGLGASSMDTIQIRKGINIVGRIGSANPRERFLDYRNTAVLDAPMASELMRDDAFKYYRDIYENAHTNTTRRTMSAETLQMKRTQEVMSFSSLQTPQGKFYSPVHFALHMLRIPEMGAKYAMRAKHGYGGGSVGDSMKRSVREMAEGMGRAFTPHRDIYRVSCPHCGHTTAQRFSKCGSCGKRLW